MTGEQPGSGTTLNVVQITPPVEATLRILLNSVPFLMGAAVVRQPPGSDGVVAQVGRMPWLHDRRLTTLQLPDDALPPNRAVALDWPVPFQAEWVGAPPRLVISRLVAQGHTVGVLLGTLITREPLSQQTREALDLSCELIASSVAAESLVMYTSPPSSTLEHQSFIYVPPTPKVEPEPEPEPQAAEIQPEPPAPEPQPMPAPAPVRPQLTVVPEPPAPVPPPPAPMRPEPEPAPRMTRKGNVDAVVEEVRKNLEFAPDARSLGRVLRDAMNDITDASAFAVSIFHVAFPEVAYRYKVAGSDRDSQELVRQSVDDGPTCYAARHDRRWHVFAREITIREGNETRSREVVVLQIPLVGAGEVFGVVTVQTMRGEGFSDHELRLVAAVIEAASPQFGNVRESGRFQPASGPPAPAEPAAAVLPAAVPQAAAAAPRARTAETVMGDLLKRCAGAGFPTAFILGVDPGAGVLRGELISDSDVSRELDYALGITAGRFTIPLDDRYNAVARAVREARIVPAPTMLEIAQPIFDQTRSLELERRAGGGRSVTLPVIVDGQPTGAIVLGPMLEDPTFSAIEVVRGYVDEAVRELAELWRQG